MFLAEGPQAVREALGRPGTVTEVFASVEATDRHPALRQAAADGGIAWWSAPEQLMRSLSSTVTPQGLVATCRFVDQPLEAILGSAPGLLAVCADIRDPGNAGTVIRCADAAGADGVVLAGDSVDPYNGKCVRASVGSLFHLPVCAPGSTLEVLTKLRRAGLQVLATDASGDVSLDHLIDNGRLAGPTAWLFGNEAHGLPDAILSRADAVVRVPIYGRAESLNLATAAAICLYASARVRHHEG
jgi:RNA methyltransferase, TrmH family